MRWTLGCALALSCAAGAAFAAEAPAAKDAAAKADPSKDAGASDELRKREAAAAMATAAAAKEAGKDASAKPQTLSEQIKDALDGKGGSTLNLGRPGAKPAPMAAQAMPKAASPAMAGASKEAAVRREAAPVAAARPSMSASNAAAASRAMAARKAMAMQGDAGGAAMSHWGYVGERGPEHWADLDPAFATCRDGQRQSPIAIESDKAALGAIDDVGFDYKAAPATVVDDGHGLKIEFGEGSSLGARGLVFRLERADLRHPSEERVDYKGFPLGVQLVHRSPMGAVAIVAVEFEIGDPNPAIAAALKSQPLDVGDRSGIMGGLDPSLFLPPPGSRKFYQFLGSLTEPPCPEAALWMVMKTPVTISRGQLADIAARHPMNARPPQPLNGRLVREQQ